MSTLKINEIFYSIQGESTRAGLPCVFIRLTGCHLRCGYCDTEYAFHEGGRQSIDNVIAEAARLGGDCALYEVTGGEPLLQKKVHGLMARLCDMGKTVLIETSGACDISVCDPRVIRIMDLKTPGSGEVERNLWSNIDQLNKHDEVKFVLCSREDYEWARGVIRKHNLAERVGAILVSAVHEVPPGKELPGSPGFRGSPGSPGHTGFSLNDLAQWILEDHLSVRIQTQLHKLIWDPNARGV